MGPWDMRWTGFTYLCYLAFSFLLSCILGRAFLCTLYFIFICKDRSIQIRVSFGHFLALLHLNEFICDIRDRGVADPFSRMSAADHNNT
jgi:hypothetical protein